MAFLKQFKHVTDGELPADGGLQVSMDGNCLVALRRIAGESKHLGYDMGRLEPVVFDINKFDTESIDRGARFVADVLKRSNLQHISAPVAAADTLSQLILQKCGFRLADSIVGHHINLEEFPSEKMDKHVRHATASDAKAMANICRINFSDRKLSVNRFLSDPNFDPAKVGDMYATWVRAAVVDDDCDANLVYDDGEMAGFYTFRLPKRRGADEAIGLAMAVLSAVHPDHHKKGVFSSLQHAGCLWLKEQGAKAVEVKTVLPNFPVNRVCQKMNGKVELCYHTFHWMRRD